MGHGWNSNSTRLFKVFLVTCNYIEDQFKLKALEGSQHFSFSKYMLTFADAQGQSVVHGLILSSFEPSQDFMIVLVTCKGEKDPIKNEIARVVTIFAPL